MKAAGSHFNNPDEYLELVNVQLQVHPVSQPRSYQVHGAGVPLLQHKHRSRTVRTHRTISARDGAEEKREPDVQHQQETQTEPSHSQKT